MTATKTTRQPMTLESGKTYRGVWRNGVQGLEGDWTADARGEYRPFVRCTWQCKHGGVRTSRHVGDGQPNIDHGTIVITLEDGTQVNGTYTAGDRDLSVTIS